MILYRLEAYNGFACRALNPPINTAYLWSFSNQYASGKYVADHDFDPNAVSPQCGAAVILFQMQQNGIVTLSAAVPGAVPASPLLPAPASQSTSAMSASDLAAQFRQLGDVFIEPQVGRGDVLAKRTQYFSR